MNGAIRWEYKAPWPACAVRSTLFAAVGQIARKLSGLTIWTVNIGVDCLVANSGCLAFKLKPSCDLFRRPTFFELLDHSFAQADKPYQLATSRTSLGSCFLGNDTV